MRPVLFSVGGVDVPTHEFFVGLGVAVALLVFVQQARARGRWNSGTVIAVCGALIGGAVGMRLSGLLPHLSPSANPTLVEARKYGARSILGGLTGAYAGVLIAKRIIGYRVSTGDLFAPAVALGMAVGRIGCLLTEAPGRPSVLPWAVYAPASVPSCHGCLAGVGMHPSYAYEILFQLAAFAGVLWLRPRLTRPGLLLTVYLGGYALFRFVVEFTRANPTAWLGLTRPQWFLLLVLPVILWRLAVRFRAGDFADVRSRRPSAPREVHP